MVRKQIQKEAEIPDNNAANENKSDVIEIPVGKYIHAIKSNPWMISTVLLGVAVIVLIALMLKGGGATGNAVSENDAAKNLLSFISAQGRGEASLVSAEKEGAFYRVTVNFEGQDIPVLVTLDGKYLVSDPVPLSADALLPANDADAGNSNQVRDVEIGESPRKGNAEAKVVMVEFTDYECPFCARSFQQTYPQIIKEYVDTGKILYVIKDFPLGFHPNAQKAAEAAHCVREQKGDTGYFGMHDLLFQNQGSLGIENYKVWAKQLGADAAKFEECLSSGKYASAVQKDASYGQQLGVSGTPAFFINGKLIEGAQPYDIFKQAIDESLSA